MGPGKGRSDGKLKPSSGSKPGDTKASGPGKGPASNRLRPVSGTGAKPSLGDPKGPGQARQRSTQMISLEPPKKRPGPRLAPGGRMDAMAARQRSGKTGLQDAAEPPPGQSGLRKRPGVDEELPFQASPTADAAPILGDSTADASDYMFRRKGTRRIPKAGGGIEGDRPALDKLSGSDRLPVAPPPPANVPIPRPPSPPSLRQAAPPPPPNSRPNSLAGVRAEDLLGEEYRPMLEEMYKRQQQVSADRARDDGPPAQRTPTGQHQQPPVRRATGPVPPIPLRQAPQATAPASIEPLPPFTAPPQQPPVQQRQIRTPSGGWMAPPPANMPPPRRQTPSELMPKAQDSSRLAFVSADRGEGPAPEQDVLAPQGDFLSGPPKAPQANVVQTPMPASPPPQSDDLGYDRPVDFGVADSADTVITTGRSMPPQDAAAPVGRHVVEEEDDSVAGLELGEVIGDKPEQQPRDSAAHEEVEQRTGYLLWLQGVITVEEVEDSLTTPGDGEQPPEILALLNESGFADQQALYRFLARHEALAPVDLDVVTPSEKALAMLRPAVARAYRVIPLAVLGKIALVAVSMPFDPKHLLELRSLTGRKVKLFIAPAEAIDEALKKYYPGGPRGAAPQPAAPGETLEQKYDPTVSGEDSGLYAPQPGPGTESQEDVAMEEASGTDASDLDESTLGTDQASQGAEDESTSETSSAVMDNHDPYAEIADAASAGGDADMIKAAQDESGELRLDDDSGRKDKGTPPAAEGREEDPFND